MHSTSSRTADIALALLSATALLATACPRRGSDAGTDTGTGADAASGDSATSTDAAATDAETDGGTASVAAELCGVLVPAVCSAVFACCDPTVQAAFGGTEAQCLVDSMIECTSDYAELDTSAALGRTVLNGATLADCTAAFDALAGACDANLFGTLFAECFIAVEGQVALGGTCTVPSTELEAAECAIGYCATGVCTAYAAAGATCSGPGGGVCDPAIHRCVAISPADSTCQPPLADGSPCADHGECASYNCATTCMPYAGEDVCGNLG